MQAAKNTSHHQWLLVLWWWHVRQEQKPTITQFTVSYPRGRVGVSKEYVWIKFITILCRSLQCGALCPVRVSVSRRWEICLLWFTAHWLPVPWVYSALLSIYPAPLSCSLEWNPPPILGKRKLSGGGRTQKDKRKRWMRSDLTEICCTLHKHTEKNTWIHQHIYTFMHNAQL